MLSTSYMLQADLIFSGARQLLRRRSSQALKQLFGGETQLTLYGLITAPELSPAITECGLSFCAHCPADEPAAGCCDDAMADVDDDGVSFSCKQCVPRREEKTMQYKTYINDIDIHLTTCRCSRLCAV